MVETVYGVRCTVYGGAVPEGIILVGMGLGSGNSCQLVEVIVAIGEVFEEGVLGSVFREAVPDLVLSVGELGGKILNGGFCSVSGEEF